MQNMVVPVAHALLPLGVAGHVEHDNVELLHTISDCKSLLWSTQVGSDIACRRAALPRLADNSASLHKAINASPMERSSSPLTKIALPSPSASLPHASLA